MDRQSSQEHGSDRPPVHDNRELNESRRDDRRYEPAGYDENTGRQYDNRISGSRGPDPRGQRSGTNSGQRWSDGQGRYDRPASRGPYGEDRYERPHSRQDYHQQPDRPSSRQGQPENRPPSRQDSTAGAYPGRKIYKLCHFPLLFLRSVQIY